MKKKLDSNIVRKTRRLPVFSSAFTILVLLITGFVFHVTFSDQLHATPKKSKLKPDHQEFHQYARYLFTKEERKLFKNLPSDEARDEFIEYFWSIRDPNPITEENEFKVEIERRYEYANRYLKDGPIPGWKTDRGRIFILLGAPDHREEHSYGNQFGRIIYWVYEESEIIITFIDENGSGSFRMSLRNVSLNLLDELERRKYYIVNSDEKENFITEVLNFDLKKSKANDGLQLEVSTKHLNYENDKDSDLMISKIKINLVIYDKDNNFSRYSEVKTVKVPKEKLLKKKYKIAIFIPMELPKGKLKIDTIISDFLGDSVHRKFVKIKN
jgi:GWxTD domain-containing protein